MTRSYFLLVPVLLLLAGCRVAPPRASVTSTFGVVRADSVERAQEVSVLSRELIPELRQIIPGLRERQVEVWVQPEIQLYRGSPYPDHIAGMADYEVARVYLREDDRKTRLHLGHELVHVLLDESWETLPGILEEGLCDLAAVYLAGDAGRGHHTKRMVEAAAFLGGIAVEIDFHAPRHSPRHLTAYLELGYDQAHEGALDLTPVAAVALDDEAVFRNATDHEGVGLYGLGYLLVLRLEQEIGLNGLRGICERAARKGRTKVDPYVIFRAARVGSDASGLNELVHLELQLSDPSVLAREISRKLAEAAVSAARSLSPGFTDAEQYLRTARPSFRVTGSPRSVRLTHLESFRESVREFWSVELES